MKMENLKYSTGSSKNRIIRMVILAVALVIGLVLLILSFYKNDQDSSNLQSLYEKAIDQSNFEAIVSIHEQTQIIIADTPIPVSDSDAEQVAVAILLRDKIETDLTIFLQAQLESVLQGASLSKEDSDKLALCFTIVGDNSLEKFDAVLRDYLLGNITESEYIHFLETLYSVNGLQRFLNEQVEKFYTIKEFRAELEPAYQLMKQADYGESVSALDNLCNSEYARIRALNRILQNLKKESLDHLYAQRMPEIQLLIDQGRLYDASLIIDSIIHYYPDNSELKQAKTYTDKIVPRNVDYWNGSIDAISVKPLIADPERAFDEDAFAEKANKDLLTAEEFRLFLEALYKNNYVLVNGNEIVDAEGQYQQILVPANKKPLLLFLDEFYFTPQRVESGICKRLDLDADANVLSVVQDRQGREQVKSDTTAIDVLENFLLDYPDFNFNGAKAVIVLSGIDGLFGYPLNEENLIHMRTQANTIGLNNYTDSIEDTAENKKKLKEIIKVLQKRQWIFASQSYSRLSVPDQSLSSLSRDTDRMDKEIGEIIGDMKIFSFAGGNHTESNQLLAGYLANAGYVLQTGSGTPYAYTVQKSDYVYLDKHQITAEKLRDPLSHALDNFVTNEKIIIESKRPY